MLYPARSILIIDVSPFGRSLALLPAMKVLREAYPNAFIAVAASTGICELLFNTGLVTETIDLGVIRPDGEASLKRAFRLIKNARRFNLDLAVDFAPRPETQFLSRVVLRTRTIAPSKLPLVIEFFTGGGRPKSERLGDYESVLRKLGLDAGGCRLTITSTPEDNAKFEELLSRNGFRGGEPVVVLYTSGGTQAWPVASFGEIAQRLANNFNARVIAGDEPADASFTAALEGLLPKTAIRLAEPRAVELMAAVARASLLITDEPNIATVARGMGTPVIEAVEWSNVVRQGRGSAPQLITTDDVYEEAAEILHESRSSSLFRQ